MYVTIDYPPTNNAAGRGIAGASALFDLNEQNPGTAEL